MHVVPGRFTGSAWKIEGHDEVVGIVGSFSRRDVMFGEERLSWTGVGSIICCVRDDLGTFCTSGFRE